MQLLIVSPRLLSVEHEAYLLVNKKLARELLV